MPVPIEEAVRAPVVVGVPVYGVCGREAGWLAVGGAETTSGDAEAKGIMPKTPNHSAEFQLVIVYHKWNLLETWSKASFPWNESWFI